MSAETIVAEYAVKGREEFARVVLTFPKGRAPAVIERDGRRYVRVPPKRVPKNGGAFAIRMKPAEHVSWALPRRGDPEDVGAPHYVGDLPAFRTRREREEYAAKQRDQGREWKYDG